MTDKPETSEEIKPLNLPDLSRSDGDVRGADSRTESTEELERRDDEKKSQHRDEDGSLADDEEDEEVDGNRSQDSWLPEKAVHSFTPNVMIVQPTRPEDLQMQEIQTEKIPLYVQNFHTDPPQHFHPPWIDDIDKPEGK